MVGSLLKSLCQNVHISYKTCDVSTFNSFSRFSVSIFFFSSKNPYIINIHHLRYPIFLTCFLSSFFSTSSSLNYFERALNQELLNLSLVCCSRSQFHYLFASIFSFKIYILFFLMIYVSVNFSLIS